ncbi:ComF family protein [Nitrospirillum sp. BR 11828]|uniref:ComF family protein n=1 Tax=Nitrospirillum sp. BR 11828 TaxID=3104325 RepID=UPI002ACAA43F|nr:ComF family protein [Nitrospirillum sp. BR 11828]MDZ5647068.1 ComF family protein [Nitrospirillum sp. BR 11828]
MRGAGVRLLDLVLPPRCLGCGEAVAAAGTLCGICWRGIGFITAPQCTACGRPFPHDMGADALCAVCVAAPLPFDRLRAAVLYDDASRPLILGFKHGDRMETAPLLAGWMARAGADMLADADLIAPVPLHRWRLFARRYNQAAVLAQRLGSLSGVRAVPDLLTRRRRTPSQGSLSREGRARNVAGAFALRPGRSVQGLRVVLVDDVYTTGATAAECARVLTRAGAARVDVLALARVLKGEVI